MRQPCGFGAVIFQMHPFFAKNQTDFDAKGVGYTFEYLYTTLFHEKRVQGVRFIEMPIITQM